MVTKYSGEESLDDDLWELDDSSVEGFLNDLLDDAVNDYAENACEDANCEALVVVDFTRLPTIVEDIRGEIDAEAEMSPLADLVDLRSSDLEAANMAASNASSEEEALQRLFDLQQSDPFVSKPFKRILCPRAPIPGEELFPMATIATPTISSPTTHSLSFYACQLQSVIDQENRAARVHDNAEVGSLLQPLATSLVPAAPKQSREARPRRIGKMRPTNDTDAFSGACVREEVVTGKQHQRPLLQTTCSSEPRTMATTHNFVNMLCGLMDGALSGLATEMFGEIDVVEAPKPTTAAFATSSRSQYTHTSGQDSHEATQLATDVMPKKPAVPKHADGIFRSRPSVHLVTPAAMATSSWEISVPLKPKPPASSKEHQRPRPGMWPPKATNIDSAFSVKERVSRAGRLRSTSPSAKGPIRPQKRKTFNFADCDTCNFLRASSCDASIVSKTSAMCLDLDMTTLGNRDATAQILSTAFAEGGLLPAISSRSRGPESVTWRSQMDKFDRDRRMSVNIF